MTTDEIRQTVSMQNVLSRYGLQPNRSGFICCPFHTEKTPSMKIYKDSFYCFGCHAHGDVFDFVERYEGVSFKEAFEELGGTYRRMTFSQKRRINHLKSKAKERQSDQTRNNIRMQSLAGKLKEIEKKLEDVEPLSDEWCDLANEREKLQMEWDERFSKVGRG